MEMIATVLSEEILTLSVHLEPEVGFVVCFDGTSEDDADNSRSSPLPFTN